MRPIVPSGAARVSRVASHEGLTMNVNRVNIPTVPFLVPQSSPADCVGVSSFVGQEAVDIKCNKKYSGVSATLEASKTFDGFFSPLDPIVSSESTSRRSTRPRYVLPPDAVTTVRHPACGVVPPDVSQMPLQTGYSPPADSRTSGSEAVEAQITSPRQVVSVTTDPPPNPTAQLLMGASCEPIAGVWFYATNINGAKIWWPFSRYDSSRLENTATEANLMVCSASLSPTACVLPVEGGRYDVDLCLRVRHSVYWDEPDTEVRRATWFYRSQNENRVLPFSEAICVQLEDHFRTVVQRGLWGQRFEIPSEDPRGGTDHFIFHSPQSIIQCRAWPSSYGSTTGRPDALESVSSTYDADPYSKLYPNAPFSEQDSRLYHVRRGLDDSLMEQLEEGEFLPIDHVYFVVHGVGNVCNLKGQGLVECVNNLRRTARRVARDHFVHHGHRVEFLPILWHDVLHSDATGVDIQLNQITLRSIPKLRQFTNGTLMDILFYTSSRYCQVIVDTVAKEICRLRDLFLSRNPNYSGAFSVIGHSLGAVILFDLLAHQNLPQHTPSDDHSAPESSDADGVLLEAGRTESTQHPDSTASDESGRSSSSLGAAGEMEGWSLVGHHAKLKFSESEIGTNKSSSVHPQGPTAATNPEVAKMIALLSRTGLKEDKINHVVNCWFGANTRSVHLPNSSADASISVSRSFWSETENEAMSAGFGMPVVVYPQLGFPLTALFMLGSPLALFLTARGVRQLPSHYHLPSCPLVFNIFHPFDPVAYRIETLIEPSFQSRAVLMPHHKGRKRLHLQLRDNLVRVGSDLRAKFCQSVQVTWRTLQEFARSHRIPGIHTDTPQEATGDDGEVASRLSKELSQLDTQPCDRDDVGSYSSESDMTFNSQLNKLRRIDFVLQEAPLESFSDYLFAFGSHAAYWESEDTSLFILTQTYAMQSVTPLTSESQATKKMPAPSLLPVDENEVSSPRPLPPLPSFFPTGLTSLCPVPPAAEAPPTPSTSCDSPIAGPPVSDVSEHLISPSQSADAVLFQPTPLDPLYASAESRDNHMNLSCSSRDDPPISGDASQRSVDTPPPQALPLSNYGPQQHGPQHTESTQNPTLRQFVQSTTDYPSFPSSMGEPCVSAVTLPPFDPLGISRHTWASPYVSTASVAPVYWTQLPLTSSVSTPFSNPNLFPMPPPPPLPPLPPPPLAFPFPPAALPFPLPRHTFHPQ